MTQERPAQSEYFPTQSEEIWQHILATKGTWKEKRHELLKTLEANVRFASFLFKKIHEINADSPTLREDVERLWHEGLGFFPKDIAKKAPRFITLEHEISALEKNSYEHMLQMSDEEWEEYNNTMEFDEPKDDKANTDDMELLREEREELLDPARQLEFIVRIRMVVDDLLRKHDILKNIGEDKDALIRHFISTRPLKDIRPEDVLRIERDPFSISMIFSNDAYKKNFGNTSLGMHFSGTPYNVIKASNPATEASTIHHENIHNLTDVGISTTNPVPSFMRRVSEYISAREKDSKDDWLHSRMREHKLEMVNQGRLYLNMLHGEILAAFEHAEEEKFSQSPWADLFLSNFEKHAAPFQTAGHHAVTLIKEIRRIKKTERADAELVRTLTQLEESIHNGFEQITKRMETYLRAADLCGENAREEIEMLFFLLPPTRYGHIAAYIAERYGGHILPETTALEILKNFYTLADLRIGITLLEKNPSLLTSDLKKNVVRQVENNQGSFLEAVEEIGIDTLEGKREYITLLTRLKNFCGADQAFEFLMHHVEFAFASHLIETDVKNEFANIPKLYGAFTDDEKNSFFDALTIHLEYIIEDLHLDDLAALKKRPLWRILESLGVADRLEKNA